MTIQNDICLEKCGRKFNPEESLFNIIIPCYLPPYPVILSNAQAVDRLHLKPTARRTRFYTFLCEISSELEIRRDVYLLVVLVLIVKTAVFCMTCGEGSKMDNTLLNHHRQQPSPASTQHITSSQTIYLRPLKVTAKTLHGKTKGSINPQENAV